MGFLVPFYLAGLTALTLPLIFHLVRRTPRGRQEFSSLMFLSPTPPRLTRRSRLDQILLLLLRLAALTLIAFAFCRPFLREAALLSQSDLAGRRVALLIDTSASLRRGDLWSQATKLAQKHLDELNPQDDIALFAFSDRLRTIIDFQKEGAAPIADKPQVIRNRLRELQPDWGATDLGTALVAIASELDSASDANQASLEPRIVVISDFPNGSRIEALQSFEWPKRIPVETLRVSLTRTTNAHATVLPAEEGNELADVRVRVTNAADSKGDQFFVAWQNATVPRPSGSGLTERANGPLPDGRGTARPDNSVAVYVPAGQSRIIRLPRGEDNLTADRVVLRGDDHDFDNTFFVVPPRKLDATVLYAGRDAANDPNGLQLYLRMAMANDPLRQVEIKPLDNGEALATPEELAPKLVVVSQAVSAELQTTLRSFAERGGTLLLVASDDAADSLEAFFDNVQHTNSQASGAASAPRSSVPDVITGGLMPPRSPIANEKYLLLGEIEFTQPLFAPFASPRYNDFTKIHFWKHRSIKLKDSAKTRIVARFDNGDPALIERSLGAGRVLALLSGWQPEESQLALSSKFVPLIGALLDLACGGTESVEGVTVGQPTRLTTTSAAWALGDDSRNPQREQGRALTTTLDSKSFEASALAHAAGYEAIVRSPDGRDIRVAAGSTFTETGVPGIYRAKFGSTEIAFAVNLSSAESNTAPLDLEQLEQRGVRFTVEQTRSERVDRIRQQRDTELEGRQKIWSWLIVLALVTLILETWWAGRAERSAGGSPANPV